VAMSHPSVLRRKTGYVESLCNFLPEGNRREASVPLREYVSLFAHLTGSVNRNYDSAIQSF
jgi:hypothetical protein